VLERATRDILLRNPRRVLVKPNIVSHEPYPTTTHPEVLDTVLHFLKRFHVQIVVGDGPAVDAGNSTQLLRQHPLQSICSAHGLELMDMHSHGFSRVKTERGFNLRVSSLALGCDYMISLPVLKVHPRLGMTGALKNQFGLFPARQRLMMHSRLLMDIHRSVAEVNTVARPHVTIMDAVKTYRTANELRHGGELAHLGYMLGGNDPLALDCHGLKLLGEIEPKLAGKSPEDIGHLAWAGRIGAGKTDYQVHRAFLR